MNGALSKVFGWGSNALANAIPGDLMDMIQFPKITNEKNNQPMLRRPRRNRQSAATRGMIRETRLHPQNLIYPLFLIDGKKVKEEIKSLIKLFAIISLCQILLYLIVDHQNWKYGKIIVMLAILIGHFFVFPSYFYPDTNSEGINCGMPILLVNTVFWVFGGGLTLIFHILYWMIKKLVNNYV